MLVFDIETTGLDPRDSKVTVVCTQDFESGEKRAYEFARYPEATEDLKRQMVQAFDEAKSLSAFNGVRFDLPFLQQAFCLPSDTVLKWVCKTNDILENSRLLKNQTFKLDLLCSHNNLPLKSADGLAAIAMARDGRFDELRDYCADDVSILRDVYIMRNIREPRANTQIDLADWAHPCLYKNSVSSTLSVSFSSDESIDGMDTGDICEEEVVQEDVFLNQQDLQKTETPQNQNLLKDPDRKAHLRIADCI